MLYARFYGFETLFGIERAKRLELLATVLRLSADLVRSHPTVAGLLRMIIFEAAYD